MDRDLALCAAAGQLRTARHLSEIAVLCASSPHRVAPHARRLGFVERVLSSTAPPEADLQDWLRAWALARLIASPVIAAIGIEGSAARVGSWGASLLHLLDAATAEVERLSSGGRLELLVRVDAGREGLLVRLDCGFAESEMAGPDAIRLAAIAGVPAVWRRDDDHLCFVVVLDGAVGAKPAP